MKIICLILSLLLFGCEMPKDPHSGKMVYLYYKDSCGYSIFCEEELDTPRFHIEVDSDVSGKRDTIITGDLVAGIKSMMKQMNRIIQQREDYCKALNECQYNLNKTQLNSNDSDFKQSLPLRSYGFRTKTIPPIN